MSKALAGKAQQARRLIERGVSSLRRRDSLSRRFAESSAITLGGAGTNTVIRLISNLALTRLLVPEDFGLAALVFAIQTFIQTNVNLGARKAALRHPDGEERAFLDTVFTVYFAQNVLIAALLGLAGLAIWLMQGTIAPADTPYTDPNFPWLVAACGLTVLLDGVKSTNLSYCARKLMLGRVVISGLFSSLLGAAVMIAIAYHYQSAWAIIIGSFARIGVLVILSHVYVKGPGCAFTRSRRYLRDIWDFGKWMVVSALFYFLATRADLFLFSVYLPAEQFGFYAIARTWLMAMETMLARPSQLTISALRESKEKSAKMRQLVTLTFQGLFAGGFLCFILAILWGAEAFVTLLYPETYAIVGVLLCQVVFVFVARHNMVLSPLALTEGLSKLVAKRHAMQAAVVVIATPLGFALGGFELALLLLVVGATIGRLVFAHDLRQIMGPLFWVEIAVSLAVLIGAFLVIPQPRIA